MTTIKPRGGEPRAVDTATPPRLNLAVPVSRVHQHRDDRGPFWVVVCPCGASESKPFTGPDGGVTAEYAKALHDMGHVDEIQAAS